jgi:Fe-S cluster assembly ATP-binding protein
MLEIKNLTVTIYGKRLLSGINLAVHKGETAVLFGPNGSGKTSLLNTIMGTPGFTIESGSIFFKGRDITGLTTDKRARLGIGMAFQRPPAIRGVRLKEVVRICMQKRGFFRAEEIDRITDGLHMTDFMDRDINLGFSGGEIKRAELLQLEAQGPEFIMLDEPDSGVDLVSITLIGNVINALLQKDKKTGTRKRAGLIITHSGHLLDYVHADRAYVLFRGCLQCSGDPQDILKDIREKGYEGCIPCQKEKQGIWQ